jgi:lipopolysaccharide export system protein LptA
VILAALLALQPAQAEDPPWTEPVGNARIRVFDANRLIATIEIESGEPESADRMKMKKLRALVPAENSEKQVRKIQVEASLGRYDRKTQVLTVEGDVSIREADSPAGERGFRSQACTVFFKEKKFETDRPFTLRKPGVVLMGQSLSSDLALEAHTVSGETQIVIVGDPRAVLETDVPPESIDVELLTVARCTGPATLRDAKERVLVSTGSPLSIYKRDARENRVTTIRAAAADIEARRDAEGRMVPQWMKLAGPVRVEDTMPLILEGESLDWDEVGRQVVLTRGRMQMRQHRIEAGRIALYEKEQYALGQEEATATIEQEAGGFQLQAESLRIDLEAVGPQKEARFLAAEGVRRISGRGAEIACGRFLLDIRRGSGTLVGRPLVRIVRGGLEARAPVAALRGESIVIGGPKSIRFKEGERIVTASCRGDLTVRGARVRLEREAWIGTPDFSLSADLLLLESGEGGSLKGLWAGVGVRVHAVEEGRPVEATAAVAHLIEGTTSLNLLGRPLATLRAEDRRVWANVLTFDRTAHRFSAAGIDRPVRVVLKERD